MKQFKEEDDVFALYEIRYSRMDQRLPSTNFTWSFLEYFEPYTLDVFFLHG